MRLQLLAVALIMAACSPQEQTMRDLDRVGADYRREAANIDSCNMRAHQNLIGMDGAAIDRSTLPRGTRVICHGCAVTMDHAPARLNVELGADGKVERLRCG